MSLPIHRNLDVKPLNQIYNKTVATYKYYWFASMLDCVVKEQKEEISVWEIIIGMITEAWYPIHYFKISFGKSDSLFDRIDWIQKTYNIPIDIGKSELKALLLGKLSEVEFKRAIKVFNQNVPYWFLSPWIKSSNHTEVTLQSQSLLNDCPYSLYPEMIKVNPNWIAYFNDNYLILRDFTFWNLTQFLQKRNPNVPDLSSKLVKPILRDSLTKQRRFWDSYIELKGNTTCIYTGKELYKKGYDLDHFIPWSFVSHNLMWNLLPADSSINSSKSNNLPPLEHYLKPYARKHHEALRTLYPHKPNDKIFEDYLTIHESVSDLINLSEDAFYNLFQKTFCPIAQIAENMGFRYWTNIQTL